MTKITLELLRDINKDTIDFIDNYDGNEREPSVLPARFPNLLVNGAAGIAVGMATNIPPHNLTEVIDGVLSLSKNPDITINELMEDIQGPDFPTAGLILGKSGIRRAYETGRGSIQMRSRAEIEERGGGRQRIVVTEIPFQVNKARMIEKIAELVRDKKSMVLPTYEMKQVYVQVLESLLTYVKMRMQALFLTTYTNKHRYKHHSV